MNFIDIIIIAALGYAAWKGFKKGFVIELFTFLALFVGLYAGIRFSEFLSTLFREQLNFTSDYLPAISFTLIFLAVGAMVYFGGKVVEKMVKVVQLSLVNKLLGILFSMLKMIFFIGAGIMLLESYDKSEKFIPQNTRDGSLFYKISKATVATCIPAFERSALYVTDVLLEEALETNENDPTQAVENEE
ncbi:MAG: CvpA family protein [Crocinitomicaceae bacterium]|nr:CvpA family protein [Crocinitomicaceae bacterium]